jgi:hypothetical protein
MQNRTGHDEIARFVQYSRTNALPDTIDVQVSPRVRGNRLWQSSRGLDDHGDFGVTALESVAGSRLSNR